MSAVGKIYKQMSLIMADVDPISKERRNTQQSYNFRGIDDVYQALQLIMAKHGVICIPTVLEDRSEERLSSAQKTLIYRILRIKYTFYAEDGSSIESVVVGEGMDSGDKASNKAMSVAQKYALLQAFCIPTNDAKDPENVSQQDKDGGVAPKGQNQANGRPQQRAPNQRPPQQQERKPTDKLFSKKGVKLSFSQEGLETMLHEAEGSAPDGIYDASKNGHKKLLGALCQMEDVTAGAEMGRLSGLAMAEQVALARLDEFTFAMIRAGKHVAPAQS